MAEKYKGLDLNERVQLFDVNTKERLRISRCPKRVNVDKYILNHPNLCIETDLQNPEGLEP